MTLWANPDGSIVVPPLGNAVLPVGCVDFTWDDTKTPTLDAVLANPSRYAYQSAAVVALPYLTLATSTASGVTTVTATLNAPPSTPPTSVTFAVAGASITVPLAGSPLTAALSVAVDAILAGASVPLSVAATGCVGAALDLATPGGVAVPLQAIAPGTTGNASTTAYRIATTSRDFILGVAASQVSQQRQVNAIAVALGWLLHFAHNDLIPWMQQASYKAFAPTANQGNAQSDIVANLIPHVPYTLADIYPSGGTPVAVYAQMKADMASIQAALQLANQYLADTPNLT